MVQLYSALLHNAYIKGFITGDIYRGSAKYVCVPGLNCYSCPGATGACPLGALQNALGVSGHRAGWYVLGILLLFGVILGRTICGWLCPMGLIQELLHKIPTPKIRKSIFTRSLSWVKYVILLVFVVVLPLIYGLKYDIPLPAFCKYICPAGTLEGAVGLLANPVNAPKFNMLGLLFTRKYILMLSIGLACVFIYRAFCRFLCPLGAIYGLFNRFNIIGMKVDASRCNHCGACVRTCGMDVRRVGDHECINCGKCMDVCSQGAISIQAGRITLKASETRCGVPMRETVRKTRSHILWGVAIAFLCFSLVWYNVLEPSFAGKDDFPIPSASQTNLAMGEEAGTDSLIRDDSVNKEHQSDTQAQNFSSAAPIGFEPGQQLQDFSVSCLDGTEFHLADLRGKIVFINLWATYCTPCVQELPYFDDLYSQHGDDIVVLAVHSSLVTDDPADYLADKHFRLRFAVDTDDDAAFSIVNGGATLPQTIVLNRRGEVVYNKVGSVTKEMLTALYEAANE